MSLPISPSAALSDSWASDKRLLINATEAAAGDPASSSFVSLVKCRAADSAKRRACVVSFKAIKRTSRFMGLTKRGGLIAGRIEFAEEYQQACLPACCKDRKTLVGRPVWKGTAAGLAERGDQSSYHLSPLIENFNHPFQCSMVMAVPLGWNRIGTAPEVNDVAFLGLCEGRLK